MRLRQCRIHACQSFLPVGAMHDQLGDHGVVKRANRIALAHTRIHADGGAGKTTVRR